MHTDRPLRSNQPTNNKTDKTKKRKGGDATARKRKGTKTQRNETQRDATQRNATQRDAPQRQTTKPTKLKNAKGITRQHGNAKGRKRKGTKRDVTQRNATQRNTTQRNSTKRKGINMNYEAAVLQRMKIAMVRLCRVQEKRAKAATIPTRRYWDELVADAQIELKLAAAELGAAVEECQRSASEQRTSCKEESKR